MRRQNNIDALQAKAAILRTYEIYSYQIAYLLLRNEDAAVWATTDALMKLAADPDLFQMLHTARREKLKYLTISSSLKVSHDCREGKGKQ